MTEHGYLSRLNDLQSKLNTNDDNRPAALSTTIAQLDKALKNRIRRELEPVGVSATQYSALCAFHTHQGLSNARFAEQAHITPQAANELVKGLERKGWVEKSPNPKHGRVLNISLTAKGHGLLEECNRLVASVESELLGQFSPTQLSAMQDGLRTLLSSFVGF
jgi:DNA-binding MarR family transcriptional regulator